MRKAGVLLSLVVLAGCGSSSVTHYDVRSALDCLQRTNSTRAGGGAASLFLLFASDDGLSATEPVFVSFDRESVSGRLATALGVTSRQPDWTERRGDARVAGYGPYEPSIAKKRGITDGDAKRAVAKLGPEVRIAVDACLTENER